MHLLKSLYLIALANQQAYLLTKVIVSYLFIRPTFYCLIVPICILAPTVGTKIQKYVSEKEHFGIKRKKTEDGQ